MLDPYNDMFVSNYQANNVMEYPAGSDYPQGLYFVQHTNKPVGVAMDESDYYVLCEDGISWYEEESYVTTFPAPGNAAALAVGLTP